MLKNSTIVGMLSACLLLSTRSAEADSATAVQELLMANPGVRVVRRGGLIRRVFGRPFSTGPTAAESAESFRQQHAHALGVTPESLVPAAIPAQPLVYVPNDGTYRFTAFTYEQTFNGLPVFGTTLRLVVRHEPGFPLVLAVADLRDLDGLVLDNARLAQAPRTGPAVDHARAVSISAGPAQVLAVRRVIWAGLDDDAQIVPRLADETLVAIGEDKWLVLTDSNTGAVLYDRHRVHFVDLSGTVGGVATQGPAAEQCAEEAPTGLPYVHVNAGGVQTTAGSDGAFSLAINGPGPVEVSAMVAGDWFVMENAAGANGSVSAVVTPPDTADLLFNPTNASEFRRAEVNGYLHANRIRDYILQFNPAYPTLLEGDFQIHVNRSDLFCPGNAWYDAVDSTLNFCRAQGGFPNTAFSAVVYHEYGHHLVEAAGSGQEEYGEGMGDAMALLVLDAPELGLGFFGNCNEPLRSADNDCQYSATTCSVNCGSEIHACGRVLSGAVWSTRNELLKTHPESYREILSSLTINSVLLHTGGGITPDIVTDFLVLDDDDATLCNGTPHSAEITAGFAAHGLADQSFGFSLPRGMPELVSPDGDTPVQVEVCGPVAPVPGSVKLNVLAPEIGGYYSFVMDEVASGLYETNFPERACGSPVRYFFTAELPSGESLSFPPDAPTIDFLAIAGASIDMALDDDFELDLGWSISAEGNLLDGAWERDVPTPLTICDMGNPGSDADGSGHAFLTDNDPFSCPTDVDGGGTILTSPTIDLTTGGVPVLVYWRWFSTHTGPNPFQDIFKVQVSSDDGSTWLPLESVGVFGIQASGGWLQRAFMLDQVVVPTEHFRVRFIASDAGGDSTVEAAVDGVRVGLVQCETTVVPGDLDGNGVVDGADLGLLLGAWGACAACPGDLNGDGEVNGADLGLLLGNWGTR